MSNTPKEETAEYNPIYCEHRKENGLSGYTLLSHSSGSGPNFQHQKHLSICLLCGNIRISGHDLKNGQIHKYNEEISIDLPDAVAAIVKNCNYMNMETDGYIPFVQVATNVNQPPTEDKQPGKTVSLEAVIELIDLQIQSILPNRYSDAPEALEQSLLSLKEDILNLTHHTMKPITAKTIRSIQQQVKDKFIKK